MGDDRKAEYEMAPTTDPENPDPPAEKAELQTDDGDQQWSGLGKEELLRVADTPAWNWTRNILLVLFWVAWVLMLIVAIVLVVKAPSCPDVEWYQKSSIYQVYVRSFQDDDGDGVGDLMGVKERVKKIKEDIGAEIVLLSPIFKQVDEPSSDVDYGYSIVDFMEIDPVLGTFADFKALVEEIQVNGMHIILEFVPNHTSKKHAWFMESSKSMDNDYRNYYIWAPGIGDGPPNDWLNYNGDDAWTKLGEEYYYHFYDASQPDLNFMHDNVTASIKEAMNLWLDTYKVDGFVIADADRLVEPPISTNIGRKRRQADVTDISMDTSTVLPDSMDMTTMGNMDSMTGHSEPISDGTNAGFVQYGIIEDGALEPRTEKVLDDLHDVLKENSYLGKYRVFIPQHSGTLKQNAMYQKNEWRGFPSCLSFANQIDQSTDSYVIKDHLNDLLDAKEKDGNSNQWNSWMIGHAKISRVASRTSKSARALTMLLYTLPGTPIPFYGDELGLTDLSTGKSPQLAPYPWDDSIYGGFVTGSNKSMPWQSVVEDLEDVNAKAQGAEDGSFLNFVKNLTEYRKKPSILAGSFNITSMNGNFFSYTRSFPEWSAFLVAINLNDEEEKDISVLGVTRGKDNSVLGTTKGTVVLSALGTRVDNPVNLERLTLAANDAYLIELEECESCIF